ncbi:hypothetical protein [Kineococcus sp. SYSU DK006]|uniref:hypothetical protein n=1 Tax=Kineococcus sp. SYSU DK006 TaxID=3383127 RepID=UPI003D7E6351
MRKFTAGLVAVPVLLGLPAPGTAQAAPAAPAPAAAASGWTAVDLGVAGTATAVNDRGVVVGSGTLPGGTGVHGFRWSAGRLTDLGADVEPQDVNDRGEIVGTRWVGDAVHGFLRTGGAFVDLGPDFLPTAINDRGDVVGNSGYDQPVRTARLRTSTGEFVTLKGLQHASDVNQHRQVLGGDSVWRDGRVSRIVTPAVLHALYPEQLTNDQEHVTGGSLNDAGRIVATYQPMPMPVCDPTRLPFAVSKAGVRDLGIGEGDATAVDVDAAGRVLVNRVQCQFSVQEVHLWHQGVAERITDRGTAEDVNDRQVVVGSTGSPYSSERHAVLWHRS